ncbi:hypothetical protein SKAU_G00181880 [Synaphobranchus kaupii]|uniref:Uncharacterized protein n=1 Tax=Synaphobranchus kaupii TaxID=118154 RepID=A0A9Q1FBX3_SYNKA|nr:hypothetical protein SKAU_G00181880 [Synaphobranchus kaupii]
MPWQRLWLWMSGFGKDLRLCSRTAVRLCPSLWRPCQNDIAVLLYAHLNFAKPPSPVSPKAHQMGTSPPPAGERK